MEEDKNTEETAEKVQKKGKVIGRPFQRGFDERRNYEGRPEGSISLTTEIKRRLQNSPEGEERRYADLLVDRIIRKGIVEGDTRMISLIWNYIDGMPKQSIDIRPINENLETADAINSLDDEQRKRIITILENIIGETESGKNEGDFVLGEKS